MAGPTLSPLVAFAREYTTSAVVGVVLTVAAELAFLRTGLFRRRAYWAAMVAVALLLVLVDGWLTRGGPGAIVLYDPEEIVGWRFPFGVPVEDYLFGWSLVTVAMLLWDAGGPGERPRSASMD